MHVRWAVAALSAITTIFGGVVAQAQSAAVSPQTAPSLPVGQVTGEALKSSSRDHYSALSADTAGQLRSPSIQTAM
jgi:hypothetical protein